MWLILTGTAWKTSPFPLPLGLTSQNLKRPTTAEFIFSSKRKPRMAQVLKLKKYFRKDFKNYEIFQNDLFVIYGFKLIMKYHANWYEQRWWRCSFCGFIFYTSWNSLGITWRVKFHPTLEEDLLCELKENKKRLVLSCHDLSWNHV